MALTNYLTGAEADTVATAGGDMLDLGVDAVYSMLMFAINFVTTNFAVILLLVALGVVITYGARKLSGAGKAGKLMR